MNKKNGARLGGASARVRREDPLGPNTEIGSKLRALFAAVEDEEIPARFIDLLERLDEAELKSQKNAD